MHIIKFNITQSKHKRIMKKTILILIALLLNLSTILAQDDAQYIRNFDFESVAPSGQTLYYKYNSGQSTVRIVLPEVIVIVRNFENYGRRLSWLSWGHYTAPTGELIIPDSVNNRGHWYKVVSIDDSTFYERDLTSISIPNSVTNIGEYAFWECSSLTSINISNSVTHIGSGAFSDCSSLTSINIPNSVTDIGFGAFVGCSSLTSISIPNSVTGIDAYTFFGCSSLTSISIPDSVTNIGKYAFYGCSSLTSISIPDSVTFIGPYAFYGCSSLTSISIPNSVTDIWQYTFYGCSSLTSISIPNSVTFIGPYAFYGCVRLDTIYALPADAPYLHQDVFTETPVNKKVIVPCNSNYDSVWGTTGFEYIIAENFILSLVSNNIDYGNIAFVQEVNCRQTAIIKAIPSVGYRFTQWSDGNTENPRTITLSKDSSLTAFFEMAPDVTVIVNSNNNYMGSVTGGGWYAANTELTLQAIPNNGYHFVHWNDNVTDNPRTVIAFSDTTFTAYFAADENAGIDGIETLNALIYTSNGEIVVDGAERNTVWLYDANGHLLSTKQNDYSLLRFNVPTSGTYFVKIGKHPAQKVIVIK